MLERDIVDERGRQWRLKVRECHRRPSRKLKVILELEVERYTMVHTAITMTGPPGLTLEADGHKRLEDILGARERGTSRSKIAAHELMLGEAGDADCRTWSQMDQVAFLPLENEEKGPLLSGVFRPQTPGERKERAAVVWEDI